MNDQTAQMGFQVGQHAVKAGQDYVEQNVRCLLDPTVEVGADNCDSYGVMFLSLP